jgi:osmotically-inducible protein OsmY
MEPSFKKRDLIICAFIVSLACGVGGIATRADAQNAAAPPNSPSESIAASETPGANLPADEDLRNRVQTALHNDPYFYDKHVTVSVKKGSVVLGGFVFSGTDLVDALRIARKAAGNTPVIDNLSIKPERPRR